MIGTGGQPSVWLARINPVAQILAILALTVTALATVDLFTPAILVAAELTLLPAAGLNRPRILFARTWPLLLSAIGIAWVTLLFAAGGGWDWIGAAALGLRVLAVALPGVLFVASTDPVRVADALTVHWRVSTRWAYGALAAIRMAPLLVTEWQAIRLARRARGVDAGRNPLVAVRLAAGAAFTLLVAAIRRGSRLAMAMDARGFDAARSSREARTPTGTSSAADATSTAADAPASDGRANRPARTNPGAGTNSSPRTPPSPRTNSGPPTNPGPRTNPHPRTNPGPRTNARGSVLHGRDYVFVATVLALCAGTTALSVTTGLWHPVFTS